MDIIFHDPVNGIMPFSKGFPVGNRAVEPSPEHARAHWTLALVK